MGGGVMGAQKLIRLFDRKFDKDFSRILELKKNETLSMRQDSLYLMLEGSTVFSLDDALIYCDKDELIWESTLFQYDIEAKATSISQILEVSIEQLEENIFTYPLLHEIFYNLLKQSHFKRQHNNALYDQKILELVSDRSLWDACYSSLGRFQNLLYGLRSIEDENIEVVENELVKIVTGFTQSAGLLLKNSSKHNFLSKSLLGNILQHEFYPIMLLSRLCRQGYEKPFGYTGDFLTIKMMYENTPQGDTKAEKSVDKCFLALPTCQAVRNRDAIMQSEILEKVRASDSEVNILALACGPATEVFGVIEKLSANERNRTNFYLVDLERRAIAYVNGQVEKNGDTNIKTINANLIHLMKGTEQLDIPKVDLAYSIGLIDYFSDNDVVGLSNWVYENLKDGGDLILGNFHPRNSIKDYMDFILDWFLVHRDEEDMNRIYSRSSFKKQSSQIIFEEQQINLFAKIRK